MRILLLLRTQRLIWGKVFFLLFGLQLAFHADAKDEVLFPRPQELEPDIQFWVRVYTEISSGSGFIHDSQYLNVVYTTVDLYPNVAPRQRRKAIESVKQQYRTILQKLARGERADLNEDERRVLKMWPADVTHRELRAAMDRIRFQLGQADRFVEGLIRSGRWTQHIIQVLQETRVPEELAALPHVESSFNPNAYSSVGAAGIWQFTRSTGKRYMRVDNVIDERMDPFIASRAAARLLKDNHETTGTWPLAITSYNHGAAGMRRAVDRVGTDDIVKILRKYDGPAFGFASRNFYVAFLAAMQISRNPEQYFGPQKLQEPENLQSVEIPSYMPVRAIFEKLGIDRPALRAVNPALRSPIWDGIKHVPRGYQMWLPEHTDANKAQAAINSISTSVRFAQQKPDSGYRVQRGDSLSGIADRFNVSVRELIVLNDLSSRNWIRAGQILRLPGTRSGELKETQVAAAAVRSETAVHSDGGAGTEWISYRVQPGDTLSLIAERFNTHEKALLVANNLQNSNRLRAGQLLQIRQGTPAVTTKPVQIAVAKIESGSGSGSEIALESSIPPKKMHEEVKAEVSSLATDKVESAEPTSEEEADFLAPVQPAGVHPALSADPTDYLVGDSNKIVVQAAETLGHYAEWLEVPTQHLRDINHLKRNSQVSLGKRIKLDFRQISKEAFEQKRIAYHRNLQEEYFTLYKITGTVEHELKRGESIWVLSQQRYNIPIWLLSQYNPDADFKIVKPGVKVIFPVVALKDAEELKVKTQMGDNP